MANKKRILFFIESFSGGGAEKVLLTILRNFNYSAYDVTVLVCSDIGVYRESFHSLPINIQCVFPTPKNRIESFWVKLKYKLLYRILPPSIAAKIIISAKNYDVLISFIEGYCTKIISHINYPDIKKIAWVHTDLHNNPWTHDCKIYPTIESERQCYQRYDCVVCVSKSVEHTMQSYYGLNNTTTIYNPINEEEILKSIDSNDVPTNTEYNFNMVVIGRLEHEKGVDKLLPLISLLTKDVLDFMLHIIGDGMMRHIIEKQIMELDIADNVKIHGFLTNPYQPLSKMDLLVCPSVAEGFSLVIAEALFLGIPVISMDCSGPNELLDGGKYGELCESYEQLYISIKRAITDKDYYAKLKNGAIARKSFFDTNNTILQIQSILK